MTHLLWEAFARQSTYPFNARKTGTLSQVALRTEALRLTVRAIKRASTFAAQAKPSVAQFRLAHAPVDSILRTTSGESDRTSLIVSWGSLHIPECGEGWPILSLQNHFGYSILLTR